VTTTTLITSLGERREIHHVMGFGIGALGQQQPPLGRANSSMTHSS
jgi:hypothetical protein